MPCLSRHVYGPVPRGCQIFWRSSGLPGEAGIKRRELAQSVTWKTALVGNRMSGIFAPATANPSLSTRLRRSVQRPAADLDLHIDKIITHAGGIDPDAKARGIGGGDLAVAIALQRGGDKINRE